MHDDGDSDASTGERQPRWRQPVAAVAPRLLTAFRDGLRGASMLRGDPGYDDARRLWNGVYDRRPGLVVRGQDAGDVRRTVAFAVEHDLLLSVKGGGHGVAGDAVRDDGLLLDLGAMRGMRVDPAARIARAQAGLTWGDFDQEAAASGLATTGGQISTTGIAGLTLGGGVGWLMREFGLTADNLRAVDLVTADGEAVRASATDNPELFWGLRGAGWNFGVATGFEYRLHPLETVLAGVLVYPLDDAPTVLRRFREVAAAAPDQLTVMAYFVPVMRSELMPPELQGKPVVAVAVCYTGPPDHGEQLLRPLRSSCLADRLAWMPYVQLQRMFDFSAPFGLAAYWKSLYLDELDDASIDIVIKHASMPSSPLSQVLITAMGGAVSEVDEAATAFGHRSSRYVLEIIAKWDGGEAAPHQAWAQAFWRDIADRSNGGVYVNFLGDEPGRIRAAYSRDTYERLQTLKVRWDPENFFHSNRNVPPA